VCQTPGIWGKLPSGFFNLWEPDKARMYITYNVEDKSKFVFDKKKAEVQKFANAQNTELCVQVSSEKNGKTHPIGHHVLSIVPNDKTAHLIVAWLITP
jgi:hypothetical protein